jgi:hypothetical protein
MNPYSHSPSISPKDMYLLWNSVIGFDAMTEYHG